MGRVLGGETVTTELNVRRLDGQVFPVDLVAGEFDAGIQLGEFIQRDMIAVRVSRDARLAVVGSPLYFTSHKLPQTPRDLKDHACIGFRFSSGIYRWEFEKGRRTLTVSPQGPATFDDPDLVNRIF